MDNNQRPHSRNKTVGSGSAGLNTGRKVNTGSGPVGGGRTSSGGSAGRRSAYPSARRSSAGVPGKKLSLKTILIIAVVIIGIIFVLKNFGGGLPSISDFDSPAEHFSDSGYTYSDASYSSYSKPDYTVSSLARSKRVTPVGGGNDVVTVMVYMCGTDLESKYGMATKDLQEMMNAKISDKVNLIVETGGCSKWKNSTISSNFNQIYKVESGGLRLLEKNAGTSAMTDPKNLTSFIDYCEKKFPADRNILILWDHGGGSLTGYGYDEKKPSSSSMTLNLMNSALKNAGCTFDLIGFDACLMATLETALVCNSYSDYLLASEETEPGTGWYYTNWLTELSSNTSISTVDIGQTIIDDFVSSSCAASPNAKVTLSLVDLAELQGTVPSSFTSFSASTNEMLRSDDYRQVSDARAGVRQFAQSSKINQVDLIDLADRIGTDESKALAEALHGCVKYNKSTITRCNGVSIYFPYESTKSVKSAVASYEALGIDDEYTKCIKSFASLEYGGQIAASATQSQQAQQTLTGGSAGGDLLGTLISSYAGSSASTSPFDVLLGSFAGSGSGSASSGSSAAGLSIDPEMIASLLGGFSGRSMPAEYDWVDTGLISEKAEDIAKEYIDPSRITATEKDGKSVLELKNDEWALIQSVELSVYAKTENGYIDLGLDNTFDWYNDDLLLEYDGTWLTLNGQACAYYLVSDTQQADGSWTTVGRIPALLNGQLVNLQVVFDKKNPNGTITGAYPMYENNSTGVQAKGNIEIKKGDKIELICDNFDANGNYTGTTVLGTPITVTESGFVLTNLAIDALDFSSMYRLTDIYGNHYWINIK